MTCLIISATHFEIEPFLEKFRQPDPFFKSKPDILITGAGLTATTYSLTKQIQLKRPELVIQAGLAGSFDQKISLGTVFAIKKDIVADEMVIESGKVKSLFDLKLVSPNKFPYQRGWLINQSAVLKETPLKKVNAVSVNEITTGKKKIDYFIQKFKPVLESMEGAALHYVCLREKIPFIQLRAASNYIGERDKRKWALQQSITNLNNALINLLQPL